MSRARSTQRYTADAGARLRLGIDEGAAQAAYGHFVPGADFLQELARSPEQVKALRALEQNPELQKLWKWFATFPGGNPIRFVIRPGLQMGGKERFGGFMGSVFVLVVNPAKREHVENPQELVNTIVHELVHAVLSVVSEAKRQNLRIPPAPLPMGASDLFHDDVLSKLDARPDRRKAASQDRPQVRAYLQREYGDSDSSPDDEYIDVNRATQRLVQRVVADNLARTGVGHVTITGLDLPKPATA